MKSRIRVKFDYELKEPYIEVRLPDHPKHGQTHPASGILEDDDPDMRDQMLKTIFQSYNHLSIRGVENPMDNSIMILRGEMAQPPYDYYDNVAANIEHIIQGPDGLMWKVVFSWRDNPTFSGIKHLEAEWIKMDQTITISSDLMSGTTVQS